MLKSSLYLIATGLLLLSSCKTKAKKQENPMHTHDFHSYAKPEEAVVKHLNLDLSVDFEKKQLAGYAELSIETNGKASELHLDARDLTIDSVWTDGEAAQFQLGAAQPYIGSDLSISIKPTTKKVKIKYNTSPSAAALQWLSPEQTAGGDYPFLFTQSQAVLARTWIPLQDSPGIRFTYSATIHCPTNLMAVMSAENDTTLHNNGTYSFKMPQAVPSYLMALAVGNLKFHSYDQRSGVYAEPVTIDKAAYEFEDMPKMIAAAEELYGPYAWGRYDVLVLPPSFPFGGMENPRLTFATPTILAGDRSLVALVAHELAHSWSGNLVTNATWDDFWLNEGFTVYFETRIMEKLYGKDYADMLTVLSKGELENTIKELGPTNKDSHLYLDLKGRDPDDGMSDIAYEKGRFFLTTIEEAVGRKRWDDFLKKYFAEHAFQSITTDTFLEYLNKELIKDDKALAEKININAWVYGPGLPSNCPVVTSTALRVAEEDAKAFIDGTKKPEEMDSKNWNTHQWLSFLRSMPNEITVEQMTALDKTFHFTESNNSEIKCDWLLLVIHSKYKAGYKALENFLCHVGRRKFVKPLYEALILTNDGKEMALKIYSKARAGYHPVTTQTIDELLNYKKP
ncbi:MAG: M1 family metallopeptidase [Bacteroidota bacterium]